MTVSSLPAIASSGLAVNQARLDVAAHHIATSVVDTTKRASPPKVDPADPGAEAALREAERNARQMAQEVVSQRVALYNFKANVGVVQAADQAMGTLLNLSA